MFGRRAGGGSRKDVALIDAHRPAAEKDQLLVADASTRSTRRRGLERFPLVASPPCVGYLLKEADHFGYNRVAFQKRLNVMRSGDRDES